MIYSPINPSDINTIQGVYAVKPSLPFTLGNEGVGEVQAVGDQVMNLKIGDWVIPSTNAWGTWRTHAIDESNRFRKISNDICPIMASTLAVNPCTAYRMLKDYVTLVEGDTVLQNGANSAVGESVIQISRHLGLQTVNIVRSREKINELKEHLHALGANYVLTNEEFKTTQLFKGQLSPPSLILNCVSGKAVIDLVKVAANQATIVTYGGMSRQPLIVPTGPLIFKDLRFVGYWMTRWNWKHSDSLERNEMFDHLINMARQGLLKPPKYEVIAINEFKAAFSKATELSGYHGSKLIFSF